VKLIFPRQAAKQDAKKQTRLGHYPQMKSVKESVIVKAALELRTYIEVRPILLRAGP
jgi:hypothetical protein